MTTNRITQVDVWSDTRWNHTVEITHANGHTAHYSNVNPNRVESMFDAIDNRRETDTWARSFDYMTPPAYHYTARPIDGGTK